MRLRSNKVISQTKYLHFSNEFGIKLLFRIVKKYFINIVKKNFNTY